MKWFSNFVSLNNNLVSLPNNVLIQLSVTSFSFLGVDHFCHGKFVQICSKSYETQSEFRCILV